MSLGRHNNNNSNNISCSSSPSHPAGSSGSYPTESSCVSKISSNNRNRQNSDQGTVATAGRASLDHNSIHPLQLDPDLATTTEEDEEEEEEEEEDEGQDIEVEMKGEVVATLTNDEQGATPTTTTALSTALPLSTVTPVSMVLATTSSFSEGAGYAGAASSSGMNQDLPTIPQPQQHVVRKKTSFAAKLRKVFNNSKALPRTPQDTPAASSTVSQQYQQEDIISLLSSDDLFGIRQVATSVGGGGGVSTHAEAMGLMDQQQHRGSVSSASSVDTIDVHPHSNSPFLNRRGSNQTETPSTSPEATPCGSPTDMSNLNTVMSVASNQQPGGSGVVVVVGPLPSAGPREMDPDNTQHRHPLSGSESSSESSSTPDIENSVSALAVGMPHVVANLPTNQTAADLASAFQPPPLPAKTTTPTRTVKKRLSFASISSFFSPRNTSNSNNATAQQEARAKQQRASSVPHVENPLVTVGRQIAGFQRRHSLNDLHDNNAAGASKISRVGVNPWEKDSNAPLSPTTTAAGAACVGQGGAATATAAPASSAHPASQQGIPKPVKKLSLNSVFNKGLRKKKKSTAANAGKPDSPLPAKPLRSALANRSKITPPGSDPAIQQHQAPKVHLVHRSSVVVAGRRRSASIRSQSSSHRRHHRHSHHQHQHQHGHHHHHGHSNHQHTDPFARLAEANHALATLNRRATDDQTGNALLRLQQQQQQQYQAGEFSTSQEEFEFCASPSSYDSTSGGLPPLDTEGLQYHHNNQSQEGLPISPTRPTTGDSEAPLDPSGSTAFSTPPTPRVLPNVTTKQGDGSEQNLDAHPITFNRSQYIHQRSALSTLSPSSSCCSYSSSSTSSDGVEGSSIRSTSDDVESCSSSSCSSKQESPVAPESAAATTGTSTGSVSGSGSESVAGSLSSRRNSADHSAVFNPLLPASAARVSVNRIAMESQLQAHNNYSGGSDSSSCNDGSVAKSIDSVAVLHDQHQNNNSLIGAGEESASTMSSSSTEVSSTTSSSSTSTNSPTKKNATVTIMNTVAEDVVSEEEAMMHAQLAYIQQQQQQYLVQQQQQHHHQQQYQQQLHQQQQMQQEHHHHHHHVHYLPQDYHHHHRSHSHHNHPHHYHSHSHHTHNQQAGYDPIPSEPHHHQPYYYPHPSLFPPRPPRQLQFSTEEPLVYPTWTPEQYDRTSDAYITASRLTPAMANKIKLELNQFKSQEMLVHEESRVYTHFFI
ncbi:bud neck involved protein [Linnemannia gamsii]|uniref:Bud neck involved protein n=1 Tax=Linnemannia gamsii TaxID=64522 RepID=A0A9P6RHS3_9FUNG|nr:bud neck involved protein [Linnemannia gamsii]